MRKFVASTLVALTSLTLVLAAVGCCQKAEQPAQESAPAMEQPMAQDTSSMMSDTAMADTSMKK